MDYGLKCLIKTNTKSGYYLKQRIYLQKRLGKTNPHLYLEQAGRLQKGFSPMFLKKELQIAPNTAARLKFE